MSNVNNTGTKKVNIMK